MERRPLPYRVRAIILPSRAYMSFDKERKVVEQLIKQVSKEYENDFSFNKAIHSSPSWLDADHQHTYISLSFRNSQFSENFQPDLLWTLRKNPQIISISFEYETPVADASLGHIIGQIPPSVRHVIFDSALPSEAFQILCVL